jgi:hypothetical protein
MRPLRILTWHIHGSYLYYLSQIPHELYVISKPGRPEGYTGKYGHFLWPERMHDIPADEVARQQFDVVLYQWRAHYFEDQYELLTPDQRRLPKIYLEHDPPQQHPTFSKHPVQDANTLLVQVTPFNALMWDSGITPTRVIEHGVIAPQGISYSGELPRGLVVVNHLARRGRRLGADLYERLRMQVPLDLVGMAAKESPGGLEEIQHDRLPAFQSHYRFFFNPIRYTSLGLAVIEAMMIGLPVVGLATTEMSTVITNGINGFVDTRPEKLLQAMQSLLGDRGLARWVGENGQRSALERFGIGRFVRDWNAALAEATDLRAPDPQLQEASS